MIQYSFDRRPEVELIAELYSRASLKRPIGDLDRLDRMYIGSNIVLSAWADDVLIGILRGWTDSVYDGYVCDLAVDPGHQRSGIGKELLLRVQQAYPTVQFVLRASRIAERYYEHLGWLPIENGWFLPRPEWE